MRAKRRILKIVSIILVLFFVDAMIPKNKYDIGRDTRDTFCYARYQMIANTGDPYGFYDEKYGVRLAGDITEYTETKDKIYIIGLEPSGYDKSYPAYLVVDKNKEQTTIWANSVKTVEERIDDSKKMRYEGALIILESYDEFSALDKKEFDKLYEKNQEQ